MSFSITEQRQKTMLERVGDAADLIDNKAFLPFYRSVQIKLEKMGRPLEWARMIEVANTKTNAAMARHDDWLWCNGGRVVLGILNRQGYCFVGGVIK